MLAALRLISRRTVHTSAMAGVKFSYTRAEANDVDTLTKQQNWTLEQGQDKWEQYLHKSFKFSNFKKAFAFMGKVAEHAEELNVRD